MANLHFNDYTFVLSASTEDEVFDDLVSKFPNINFERQDLELNYNQRVDAFFLSNGIKKYEVGNLKFETINEKTSIKTTETTNNAVIIYSLRRRIKLPIPNSIVAISKIVD